MKTFAQLKRDLKVGTKVKLIYHAVFPDKKGLIRTVTSVFHHGIAFDYGDNLSWFWWEKASNYEYDGKTFKVFHNKILDIEYEVLDNEKN